MSTAKCISNDVTNCANIHLQHLSWYAPIWLFYLENYCFSALKIEVIVSHYEYYHIHSNRLIMNFSVIIRKFHLVLFVNRWRSYYYFNRCSHNQLFWNQMFWIRKLFHFKFAPPKNQAVNKKFPILPVSPGPPPDVKSGLLFALDIFPWIDLNYNNIIAAASSM